MNSNTQPTPERSRPLIEYSGYLLRLAHNRAVDATRSVFPGDPTLRRYAALALLEYRGSASQQEIAEILHINRTLVVKLVDDLEQEHLVVRHRDSDDRRAYAVTTTIAGRRTIAGLRTAATEADTHLTVALARRKAQRLNRLLVALLPDPTLADVPGIGDCTALLIIRVHQHVRDLGRAALAPISLEPRLFGALAAIDEIGTCMQQELANHLRISPPVVLGTVNELDDAGLLDRVRSTADRRAYRITLTAAGRRRLAAARKLLDAVDREISRQLGSPESHELQSLLAELVA